MQIVTETKLPEHQLLFRGKVRDIYELDARTLLIVATDRLSAFDVVMNEPVPYRGVILNRITLFWMDKFKSIVANHLLATEPADFPASLKPYTEQLEGRSVIVRKTKPLPVECIVRGYITGSGWEEYKKTGAVCGQRLPDGLTESERLPQPLFTPSTKAEAGRHDENISLSKAADILGSEMLGRVKDISLALFEAGGAYALERGIIIADTKFEFGLCGDELLLIDEVLTPDSSRFWPADQYIAGHGQPSFDKQYVRDWLKSVDWDRQAPPPSLPAEVISNTADKYLQAYKLLTGNSRLF